MKRSLHTGESGAVSQVTEGPHVGLGAALQMLARGGSSTAVLGFLAKWVEEELGRGFCAIYQVDPAGPRLTGGVAPSMPGPMLRAFDGRAVHNAEQRTVIEIGQDPSWNGIAEAAALFGLNACWSNPILSPEQRLVGALLVCLPLADLPSPDEAWLLTTASNLAAVVIERGWRVDQRQHRVRAIVQHMYDGVIATDDQGKITVANAAALRLLGISRSLDGKRLEGAGLPAPLFEALRRIRGSGNGQERVMAEIGESTLEAVVSPLMTATGRRYGAVAVLHDLTVSVRYRRLQDSFVANVSHELRAPLAALSAAVEALADGLIPEPERPRYFQAVLKEVGRLRRLSTQLVDLARLEAGVFQVEVMEVELGPVLEDLAYYWAETCRRAGVSLMAACPPLRVRVSPEHLEEVMANLLDNALQFTPTGGTIEIRAYAREEMVQIDVVDTGLGIDPRHLPYIWERFYMADQARTRTSRKGSGLGLSLVRRLVELQGGQVFVSSTPGSGSTFSFTLPSASAGTYGCQAPG